MCAVIMAERLKLMNAHGHNGGTFTVDYSHAQAV